MKRRALVTGANRGLGLETCRQLAEQGVAIILASRDVDAGVKAAAELGAEHLALDVTDPASISAAVRAAGPIDILVANAAIALDGFDDEVVKKTIDTNYFGTARVIDAFLPSLRRPGAIVVVSSGLGELSMFERSKRERFLRASRAELDELMREFIRSQKGWPHNAYGVSKAGVNMLVRILAAEHPDLSINAVCPGWVRTRMGGRGAPLSVEDGADTIVWAAMFERGPSGKWFRERAELDW